MVAVVILPVTAASRFAIVGASLGRREQGPIDLSRARGHRVTVDRSRSDRSASVGIARRRAEDERADSFLSASDDDEAGVSAMREQSKEK